MWNKIFNSIVVFLLLCSLWFSWFLYFNSKKNISSLNYEIETLTNELNNSKAELTALKSFTDSINRWFDVNVVEAIISNTRSWFEWWFQSIKSYLVDLNKEVKTLKENQAIILTKIDKYEEMTKWLDSKSNLKDMIEKAWKNQENWNNLYYQLQTKIRDLETKVQTLNNSLNNLSSSNSTTITTN